MEIFFTRTCRLGAGVILVLLELKLAPAAITWSVPHPGNLPSAALVSAPGTSVVFELNPHHTAIGFESEEHYVPGPLVAQQGWTSQEDAMIEVVSGAPAGASALKLGPHAAASYPLDPVVSHGVIFVDFQARFRMAPGDYRATLNFYFGPAALTLAANEAGTAVNVLAGKLSDGYVYVPTGTSWPLDATRDTGWHRLSVRVNYSTRRWDIYVDARPVATELNMVGTGLDKFRAWHDSNGSSQAWVDQVRLTGTNPLFADADHDGMDDEWETQHDLDPKRNDRDDDLDRDGLSNINEYGHGTDPQNPDTDGDAIPDGWEVENGLNPLLASDAAEDFDKDGLNNATEYAVGTDPRRAVSDASGIPDAELDFDNDGVDNLREVQQGIDPADYYNGRAPVITLLADYSEQLGPDGMFAVRVADAAGHPLANAPVQFTTSAESRLTLNPYGLGSKLSILAHSGDDGIARVYVRPGETEVP